MGDIENQVPIEADEDQSFWKAGFSVMVQRILMAACVILLVLTGVFWFMWSSRAGEISSLQHRAKNTAELSGQFAKDVHDQGGGIVAYLSAEQQQKIAVSANKTWVTECAAVEKTPEWVNQLVAEAQAKGGAGENPVAQYIEMLENKQMQGAASNGASTATADLGLAAAGSVAAMGAVASATGYMQGPLGFLNGWWYAGIAALISLVAFSCACRKCLPSAGGAAAPLSA